MPYRRLPNTDSSRLKSLKSAYGKGKDLPPFKLAFSAGSYRRMQAVLPQFENAISEHKNSLNLQAEKNKEYQKRLKKVRLYISHFVQVVNMAIVRGDLNAETRNYFGLEEDERKVPSLSSEEDVLKWGEQLIEGEKKRRNKGINPDHQSNHRGIEGSFRQIYGISQLPEEPENRSQRAQDQLNDKRSQVDGVIQQIWNEVEHTYNDLPEEMRREKASEYGLVYVFVRMSWKMLLFFSLLSG